MKKLRFVSIAAVTVVCLLAMWVSPLTPATAATTPTPVKVLVSSEHNRAVQDRLSELRMMAPSRNRLGETDPLPSSYSSVTEGYMTPVKDQNPYGTCWAHAAMACAETATIKNHLTDNPVPDYSELALAYFTYNTVADPLGGLSGDTITMEPGNYLDAGGNMAMTAMSLGNWRGVTEESLAPYAAVVSDQYFRPDAANAYDDVLHLEDAQWLPMATDADRELIKRKLLEYGAADVSVYYDDDYYNESKGCYYTNQSEYTNHEVVLCGWDDNYAASNFSGSPRRVRPSQNGAWLIRNSWGDDWGNDGYFWVSYYDAAMCMDVATFYDFAPADRYDYNYQYDGVASGHYLDFSRTKVYTANVFTAQHDEELHAVSNFYYNSPGGTYTIRVYTGVFGSNPMSGTLVATVKGTYEAMGMQTDELPTPVTLTAGTRFSVVYEQTAPEDLSIMASMDYSYDGEIGHNAGSMRQSYYSLDGRSWTDMFDASEDLDANLRIHAYTKAIGGGESSESSEGSEDPSEIPSEAPSDASDESSDVTSDEPSEPASEEPSDVTSEPTSEPVSEPTSDISEPSDPSEIPDETVLGDADGDGEVSMKDVLKIRKLIAGLGGDIDETAADVNRDGSVDMKDVLLIRKFIAGLIKPFE